MKILVVVIMFFLISALMIISNNNLSMYKQENLEEFSELYVGWVDQVYVNIQTLTGNAIRMDWVPK